VAGALAKKISSYCKCQYTMDYIEVWDVRCQPQNSDVFDVILTGRLIPTNLKKGTDIMKAMSDWMVTSEHPKLITVDGQTMNVDKNCKVQIEHPYGTDCVQAAAAAATVPPTTGPPTAGPPTAGPIVSNNDNDDDDDSAGAVVGGVIAGLLIVCITIVVLVVVVMLLRRREKRYIHL